MSGANRVIRLEADGPEGTGLAPLDLDPADFHSPLPRQHAHVYHSDAALGMTVGVWDTTTMQEAFGPYPGDEFIVVLEGSFTMLDRDGKAFPARAGQTVILRNGAPMSWKQDGYLKKFFLTLLDPAAPQPRLATAQGGVIVLESDAALDDGDEITRSESGALQRRRTLWTNDAGTMEVGLRDSEAMTSEPFAFPRHEFAQILDGSVTITEEDGTSQTFGAGDVLFIPAGIVTRWHVPDYVRKYYAAVTPQT